VRPTSSWTRTTIHDAGFVGDTGRFLQALARTLGTQPALLTILRFR
jgi:hypothetical protein